MKLFLSLPALDDLIDKGFIKPNHNDSKGFLINVVSNSGELLELAIVVEEPLFNQLYIPYKETAVVKPISTNVEYKDTDNGHSSIEEWIDNWRKSWSGKRVKAMGVRDKVVLNMREFFQLYPKYTRAHVFKARDRYVDSLKGEYTYMEQADYFIKKRVISQEGETETRRTLLMYCEEVVLEEQYGIDTNFSIYDDI